MTLPHHTPDCTGTWHQEFNGSWLYWRCSECESLAYPSGEMQRAALRENPLGYQLTRLTREGQKLLGNA